MDRATAARVLGVPPEANPKQAEKAFRARARVGHPDRFPPGSEAWEDATHLMAELNEARAVLTGAESAPSAAPSGPTAYVDSSDPRVGQSRDRSAEGFRSAADTDRLARLWGYAWGGFLVVAAIGSFLVGASSATNDAVPVWSPALAVIGAVALAIGWRADRRLRRGGRGGS